MPYMIFVINKQKWHCETCAKSSKGSFNLRKKFKSNMLKKHILCKHFVEIETNQKKSVLKDKEI